MEHEQMILELRTPLQSKVCSHCKRPLPVSEFYGDKGRVSGLYPRCRDCIRLERSGKPKPSQAGRYKRLREEYPEGMKRCSRCKGLKLVDEFFRNNNTKTGHLGLHPWCKLCDQKQNAAYRATPRGMASRRKTELKRMGLTPERYDEFLRLQGGGCAICGERPAPGYNLRVDHDHRCCPGDAKSCGKCIRGLLCGKCNTGLGQFLDSEDLLLKAAAYVRASGIGTREACQVSPTDCASQEESHL
jgi:Recombination endonuclease VII